MRRRWVESGWECRMIWTPWFVWEDPRVELIVLMEWECCVCHPPVCNNDIEASVLYVVCICCLFGQWCSSEVINKNPREVVLIVLIIPIVELVALIIPVVYPVTSLILVMVTLTIQLNTISTVTTVTLLILQLWHFYYSSEGADAERAPTIPN